MLFEGLAAPPFVVLPLVALFTIPPMLGVNVGLEVVPPMATGTPFRRAAPA